MAGMYMGDPMRVPSLYNPQQGGFPSLNKQPMPANVMPGDQPGIPEMQMPGAEKPKAWGKGGRAWQIMGVIGDALQTAGGGEATFMPTFLDLQEQTRKERETQQKLQAQVAAMAGIGLNAQQSAAVQAGVAQASDFMPGKTQPHRWEDNAGNQWEMGADGQTKRIFTDRTPKYYVQGDKAVRIANPYENEVPGRPAVGATISMSELDPPSIRNTPSPALGSNGFPSVLSPMQYQALVNEKGKAATDAFISRNNIQIGN